MEDFTAAMDEFVSMMGEFPDPYDYYKIALDSLMVELMMAPWDSIGIMSARPEQREDRLLSTLDAMEEILARTPPSRSESVYLPRNLRLYQNYPNPFNATTQFRFDLPHSGMVKLEVFDGLGRSVATLTNQYYEAGTHRLAWNASGYASGLYFCRLIAGGESRTMKIMLLK